MRVRVEDSKESKKVTKTVENPARLPKNKQKCTQRTDHIIQQKENKKHKET